MTKQAAGQLLVAQFGERIPVEQTVSLQKNDIFKHIMRHKTRLSLWFRALAGR